MINYSAVDSRAFPAHRSHGYALGFPSISMVLWQNRRIGKMVNGLLVRSWIYEDQLRPAAELDGAGNVVARFVYGTKVNVSEYVVKDGTTYRIVTDHLGSPRLVVDASTGTVVQRLDFDEYGVVLSDDNPSFQPFGFAGGLYDHETGLVRFGVRDYGPKIGRWMSKDPTRFHGFDINLFRYCGSDPVNWLDPDGKSPLLGTMAIGAAAGAIGGYLTGGKEGAIAGAILGATIGSGVGLVTGAVLGEGIISAGIAGGAGNALGQFVTEKWVTKKNRPISTSQVALACGGAMIGYGLGLMAYELGGTGAAIAGAIGGEVVGAAGQNFLNFVKDATGERR